MLYISTKRIGQVHVDYYEFMSTEIIVMDVGELGLCLYYADPDKWCEIIDSWKVII